MAFRPKTLTAAIVPILTTSALVYGLGYEIKPWVSIFALLSSICIQIGTNLVNDAVDFRKGADTEKRIGPQRVTQSGLMSYRTVMFVAFCFFMLAVAFGIPLVLEGGMPIIILGLLSVAMGYSYTAGPFPLAYLGLGDVFVILFFGLIAVGGLFFLQTETLTMSAIVLGLQVGLHCAVLIAINNLRDVHGDKLVNKRTLAVRFGIQFAKNEILFLCLSPFLLQFYWIIEGKLTAFVFGFAALPLALKIIKGIKNTDPSEEYNKYLAQSAGLHFLFSILLSIGFLV